MRKVLIAVVGPTAAGKTDFAIELALKYKTEIISTDSRQFYKELKIGVARPSEQQLEIVKHHFIATRSVEEEYAAGQFGNDARELLQKLFENYEVVIAVGGSGLYLKAFLEGLDELPPADENIRLRLQAEFEQHGLRHMQEKLRALDPEYYEKCDIQNHRRILRALEVILLSGKKFSSFRTSKKIKNDFEIIKIGLTLPRKTLYEKIDQRVNEMIKNGLLEEAGKHFFQKHLRSLQTVGYQEFFRFFENEIDLETAIALIKQNSRNYAKRQLTWFRKDQEIQWFEPHFRTEILLFIDKKWSELNAISRK